VLGESDGLGVDLEGIGYGLGELGEERGEGVEGEGRESGGGGEWDSRGDGKGVGCHWLFLVISY
jgi:hypothetical protein